MKTRILLWTLVAILILYIASPSLGSRGIVCGMPLISLLVSLLYLGFVGSVIAIHIGLCLFVWRDAESRSRLLIGIPSWVWGLMALTTGIIGLAVYWFANYSRFVREQEFPKGYREKQTQPSAGGDGIPPPQP